MYKIRFVPKAIEDLQRIDPIWQKRIKTKIELLRTNPDSLINNIKPLKGKYKGLARLRIGSYRVTFQVKKDKLIILIIRIASRQEIY